MSQTERAELDLIQDDIAVLKTNYLSGKINETIYSMQKKPFATAQNDYWERGRLTGEWYLTEKGFTEVNEILKKVGKEKRDIVSFWVSIIFGLNGMLIALISVI